MENNEVVAEYFELNNEGDLSISMPFKYPVCKVEKRRYKKPWTPTSSRKYFNAGSTISIIRNF